MITFFNSKDVLITADIDRYANAKDDLAAAGIKFRLKSTPNTHKHSWARSYTFGNTTNVLNSGAVYTITVHEKDFDKAVAVINGRVK